MVPEYHPVAVKFANHSRRLIHLSRHALREEHFPDQAPGSTLLTYLKNSKVKDMRQKRSNMNIMGLFPVKVKLIHEAQAEPGRAGNAPRGAFTLGT